MQTLAVVAGTVLILLLSRRSLRYPRAHGFYRLFVFECLLLLVVLNAPAWFRRPLAVHQLVSWALLAASATLAIHAFSLFHRVGRPEPAAPASPELHFEHTTVLVTVGAYRRIRHPMYASLILLAVGAALKSLTGGSLLLAAVATVLLWHTARVEERENLARFGPAYRDYMARTRMFIPWLV